MYYSSGSTPSGIFSGTTTSLGDFDQCLRIGEMDNFPDTQYCLLILRIHRRAKFTPYQFNLQQKETITLWARERLDGLLATDNRVPIAVGICMPIQCTVPEMNHIVHSG